MTLRVGCVPYLNAKPVIDWFHSPAFDGDAEVSYAVPSELAQDLRGGRLDVALVSTFELFRAPGLRIIPDISISADGMVRSVRLFSKVPFERIRTVAMDLGSLTSVALTRIVLSERYGVDAAAERSLPDLDAMLADHDAALIIGKLDDFQPRPPYVMDLGEEWKCMTGLPFCYAAWLAPENCAAEPMLSTLSRAKEWGALHRGDLVKTWSARLNLPPGRVAEYLCRTISYDLGAGEKRAMWLFQEKCRQLGLVDALVPLDFLSR